MWNSPYTYKLPSYLHRKPAMIQEIWELHSFVHLLQSQFEIGSECKLPGTRSVVIQRMSADTES